MAISWNNREDNPCGHDCKYGEAGEYPRDLGPDGKPLPGDDPDLVCICCGWKLGDVRELEHQDMLSLHNVDALDGDRYCEYGGES